MLEPYQKVYAFTRSGEIQEVEYIKPAFVVRMPSGRMNVAYRIYESKEDAETAFAENGYKVIKSSDVRNGIVLASEALKEVNLLKLRIEVMKQKTNRPWWKKLSQLFTKKED